MTGKYSQRTGITRFNVLTTNQLSVGTTVSINEDNNGTIKGQKIIFTQLRNNGNEIVFTNNDGELREVNSAESGETSNDLVLTQKAGSSPIEYIFKSVDDIGSGMTPTGSFTISGLFNFSTTPIFSALNTNGFMRTTSSNGTITSSPLVLTDLPSIPNSKLDNSTITINGSSISLGGSTTIDDGFPIVLGNTTISALSTNASLTTFSNIGGDNVQINTSNGSETYTWRQGSGGGSDAGNLELHASMGSVNRMLHINNLGGITFNSAYSTGILHCDASANITSSALAVSDLPSIPNSKLDNSTITINSTSVALGGSISITANDGFPFSIGSTSITTNSSNPSLAGITDLGLTGELQLNNSTSQWKFSNSLNDFTGDRFLLLKYHLDTLVSFDRTNAGVYLKRNYKNTTNWGYNNFDTSSSKLRIILPPSAWGVANGDEGAGNITPVFIKRDASSNKAKFGATHQDNSVELYAFYSVKYGYKAHSLRVNCFAESDGSEVSETLGISRYYITSTGNSWLSTTETTNSTYTFDPADNVQTTSLDDPYIIVLQVHHSTGNVIKGAYIDLESII